MWKRNQEGGESPQGRAWTWPWTSPACPSLSALSLPQCHCPGRPVFPGFPLSPASELLWQEIPGREEREVGVLGFWTLPSGVTGGSCQATQLSPAPCYLPVVIAAPLSCALGPSLVRASPCYTGPMAFSTRPCFCKQSPLSPSERASHFLCAP